MYELGRSAFRRRKTVVAIWVALLVALGALAGILAKDFDDEFTLPGSESQQALDSLNLTFPEVSGTGASVIVVAAEGDEITGDPYRAEIEEFVEDAEDFADVTAVTSPFMAGLEGVVNAEETAAIVNLQYDGDPAELGDPAKQVLVDAVDALAAQLPAGAEASAGGGLFSVTGVHISWVEAVGVVIAFFVLLFTLGSLRAAGMPLITALLGVAIGMILIVLSTAVATVNSTTPMLALMLGLAVGIDYALFIVSRARDLMAEGHSAEEAAARATATSGSAVVFAGVTVIIALVGLGVARMPFLTVMGVAAAATVAIAVVIAVTMVPALLGLAGDKVRPKPAKKRADGTDRPRPDQRFFGAWETVATKVPALTVVLVVVGLSLFALPASRLELALPDNGSAEEGSPAKINHDLTEEHFGPGYNGPLVMTAGILSSTDPLGDMQALGEDVEAVDGVEEVVLAVPNPTADTGIVQIIPEFAPDDQRTNDVVHELREMAPQIEDEYGFETAVTGSTAVAIDVSEQLGRALLPFGIFVVGLSVILLTMVFRSIWVPVKATFGYLLSVVTAFGAVVLVFHDGLFASALGLSETGPVISFLPIILMGILFGLAMDYEVFLVSGMREAYVHGAGARGAIRKGFMSSARVVSAAAIIMFSVFAAFVPASESIIKSIALGLAVGIFVDAFIVRMTLVPAVMALLGDRAWWLPGWLDRIMPRFDVEGEGLFHQVELRDWPEPDSPYRAYGEGLGVGDPASARPGGLRSGAGGASGALFAGVDVALLPGQVLTVTGHGTVAFLLTLTGRLNADRGELKIGRFVMPEQAGKVRARTPLVVLDSAEDSLVSSARELAKLAQEPPELLVVDRADSPRDERTARLLTELVRSAVDSGSAVVLGVDDPDADWMIPPQSTYTLLDLDIHRGESEPGSADSASAPAPASPESAPAQFLGGHR
nr:MMPL family transporter [Brevibacterium daeguense]